MQGPIRTWCKHGHLIQHACIRPRVIASGLYLHSVHFWSGSSSERCRGSRRSRDVVGSSCSRGDGSGSSCSCPVDVRGPRGLRGSTVVVHATSGYLSVRSWRCRCTHCRGTCRITGCSRTRSKQNLVYPCTWQNPRTGLGVSWSWRGLRKELGVHGDME